MTKIIAVTAPRTAGATIIASNLAIAHQWRAPQKKVGVIQLSQIPDLYHYMGFTHKRHMGDLVSFWKTKEWGASLLDQIVQVQGVEVILSPTLRGWGAIDQAFFIDFWALVTKRYDVLYVDMDPKLPSWVWTAVEECIKICVNILSMGPASFSAYEQIQNQYPSLSEKSQIIINQVDKREASEVRVQFSRLEVPLLGTLPVDTKALWHQVYEGIPVVMQRRSKLGKAIEKIIDHLL